MWLPVAMDVPAVSSNVPVSWQSPQFAVVASVHTGVVSEPAAASVTPWQ